VISEPASATSPSTTVCSFTSRPAVTTSRWIPASDVMITFRGSARTRDTAHDALPRSCATAPSAANAPNLPFVFMCPSLRPRDASDVPYCVLPLAQAANSWAVRVHTPVRHEARA
jgi:hypothetical protein